VSTEEQARTGLGLSAQREAITREASRRGWEVTWHVDQASGRSLDRPALTKALNELAGGRASALVVAKLDRLSRSLSDFAQTMNVARKQQWALVALDLGVDTTTPAGELVANVMAAVAQWERRVIGARTSEALQARKQAGLPLGRPRSVSDAALDQLIALRESGMAFAAIARQLNETNTPTATGQGRWTGHTVARMIARKGRRSAATFNSTERVA
jgi:DNA invertase Pin-like site-specific DNA recombinase